jgi:hypothetical protein
MKKILLLISLLVSVLTFAQNKGITYQAVIYSASGESIPGIHNSNSPLVNKLICLQFSIVDENTQTEYQEKITVTTDDFGMVNLVIGNGTQTGGYASSFNTIVWSNSKKYLKVSVDQSGACSTFEEISNQVLNYVPFALAADSATSVSGIVGIANGGTNATTVIGAKTNLQLQNVDNTSDLNKPLSTATQNALNTKVDKVAGKDLSTNDFTTAEKTKLASLGGTQDLSNYATLTNLQTKVDKVVGKDLSTNDFTTAEKTKLATISGVNTGDQDLSLYATNTALALKAPLASPNFTGIMGLNNRAEFGQNIEREQPSLKLIGFSKPGTGVSSFWPTQPYAGGGLEIGDGGAVRLVIYRKNSNTFNISTTGSLNEGIGINADTYDPAYTLDINGTLGVRNSITSTGTITAGTVTYPNVDGTPGQVLATNGTGVVAWTTPSAATNSDFVDLTSNQTITGSKTFSSNVIANLSGNATSATNIEGGSIGQLPYQNSSNSTSFLSPNTSNVRKFLSSVGSNGGAIAPSWQPLTPSDIVSSSSQTSGYLNFETGGFGAQNWTELNSQWTITSGWANTRDYNGTAYQGSYSIIAPDSQDFTLESSKDFNLASLYIKGDGMQTATSVEFKGYSASGALVSSIIVNTSAFNYFFSNVNLNFNGIRKLVFHPIGYDPNAMGGGSFFLDYFDVSILTSNNLNSVNGLLKSNGSGSITAAVAGTYYLSPTGTASQFLKANGSIDTNTYVASNTDNIAIGYVAGSGGQGLHSIAIGSNVAQGIQAEGGVGVGYAAAQYNQGENAVAIGKFAGQNNQAANSVAIGSDTQVSGVNSVALGSGANASTDNTIQLGNSSVTNVNTYGSITANAAISSEITSDLTIDSNNVELYKGRVLICNPSSPITITFAIGVPIGFNCMILQKSADANKINVAGGSGVTMKNRNNYTATAGNYAIATIVSIGGDIIVTAGDMQ